MEQGKGGSEGQNEGPPPMAFIDGPFNQNVPLFDQRKEQDTMLRRCACMILLLSHDHTPTTCVR